MLFKQSVKFHCVNTPYLKIILSFLWEFHKIYYVFRPYLHSLLLTSGRHLSPILENMLSFQEANNYQTDYLFVLSILLLIGYFACFVFWLLWIMASSSAYMSSKILLPIILCYIPRSQIDRSYGNLNFNLLKNIMLFSKVVIYPCIYLYLEKNPVL